MDEIRVSKDEPLLISDSRNAFILSPDQTNNPLGYNKNSKSIRKQQIGHYKITARLLIILFIILVKLSLCRSTIPSGVIKIDLKSGNILLN